MSIFSFLSNWRKHRLIRKVFGHYMSKSVIENLLKNPEKLPCPEFKEAKIHYILIRIKDDDIKSMQHIYSEVTDLIIDKNGYIDVMFPPFILVSFLPNLYAGEDEVKVKAADIINALLNQFDKNIKLVYGCGDAGYGNYGGKQRLNYGAVFYKMEYYRQELDNLGFGEKKEVN